MAARRKKYLANLINRGLRLGDNVQIVDTFFFDPSHCFLISIGDNCTICPNVRLIAHDASTKKFLGYTKIGKITIHENCFIGDSVIVLPNVAIGPGAIVGAGSVVTRDIPEGVVAAGSPAKPICSVSEYLNKVEEQRAGRKIFDETYYISNISEEGREEVLKAVTDRIGFIR